MKLYTEEQVKKVIKDSFLQGIERNTNYESVKKSILNSLTPIELPSDEEINEVAIIVYGFDAMDIKDVLEYKAFKRGAKFVINKIQGGNK